MEGARDKLLTFTDNRQDASLQSGHFNYFIHASLPRCALHAALHRDHDLTFHRLAEPAVAQRPHRAASPKPGTDPASPAPPT